MTNNCSKTSLLKIHELETFGSRKRVLKKKLGGCSRIWGSTNTPIETLATRLIVLCASRDSRGHSRDRVFLYDSAY